AIGIDRDPLFHDSLERPQFATLVQCQGVDDHLAAQAHKQGLVVRPRALHPAVDGLVHQAEHLDVPVVLVRPEPRGRIVDSRDAKHVARRGDGLVLGVLPGFQPGAPAQPARREAGAISGGIHAWRAGSAMFVHDDAVADFDTRRARHLIVRRLPDRDDAEVMYRGFLFAGYDYGRSVFRDSDGPRVQHYAYAMPF